MKNKKWEVIKLSLNEVVDKLDRTTEECNAMKAENEKLKSDVKGMQADNALLFKKVVSLQDQLVEYYNKDNEASSNGTCTERKKDEGVRTTRAQSWIETLNDNFDFSEFEEKKEDYSFFMNNYWLPSRPTHKKVVDDSEILALTYNFRGTHIATGSGSGELRIWDTSQGNEVKRLKNFNHAICALSFSTDNQNLVAWYVDGSIRVWRMDDLKAVNNFHGHSDLINWSSYSHTSNSLITGSSDRKIKLWDIFRGVCTTNFSGNSTCLSIDSVPYGSLFASGHQDGTVKFWTPTTKNYIKCIEPHGDPISSVNFTSDGRYLLTTSLDHTLKLIDVKDFEEVWMFESEHYLNGGKNSRSAVSPSGDYAVTGSQDGSVIVIKLLYNDMELEEVYQGEHTSTVTGCEWQPNGGSFSTVDSKGNFIIWQ